MKIRITPGAVLMLAVFVVAFWITRYVSLGSVLGALTFALQVVMSGLPNIEPVSLLVMGYPADDAKPLELHYKSRPIEETVFYDSF